MFGQEIAQVPIDGQIVLPTSIKTLNEQWNVSGLLLGRYLASASIVDGDGNSLTTDVISFWAFPVWYGVAFVLTVLVLFVALMLAALPGLIDYTLFLWRERTDMLGMRLDIVYAIFPFYFAVVVLRMLVCIARLAGANWRTELRSWGNDSQADTP